MRVVGVCSTWQEGRLAASAVRSLRAACDVVHVYDGPIGQPLPGGSATDWRAFKRDPSVVVHTGEWETDAAKRTAALAPTRRLPPPVWGVILDGDELLLHGELIPDLIEWSEADAASKGEMAATFGLRLVEVNGSVSILPARVIRLDLVARWVASSNQIEFVNGIVHTFPNQLIVPAGAPDAPDSEQEYGIHQRRRPLAGEPHVLHRSGLRDPARAAARQHVAEASEWERLVASAGLANVPDKPDDGVRIWLPQ